MISNIFLGIHYTSHVNLAFSSVGIPTHRLVKKPKYIYINKNHGVKIKPKFSNNISYTWLTDKRRHFFEGILAKCLKKILN